MKNQWLLTQKAGGTRFAKIGQPAAQPDDAKQAWQPIQGMVMRTKSNEDRDKHLEKIGFNLGQETILSSQACQVCGYDRIWTAERYRNWCVCCGTGLPVTVGAEVRMVS